MNDYMNKATLKGFSKTLRKNMIKEERHLWFDFLKTLPVTVNRQKVLGNYIVDFFIASKRIAIELDGSQHFEYEDVLHDHARDEWLKRNGITVLRYNNLQVNREFRSVCEDILQHLERTDGQDNLPLQQIKHE